MFKQLQKLGLALLVGAFSISNVNSQVIFSEDFNGTNPLANWTLIDNDGLTPQPNYSFFTDAWVIINDADSIGMMDSVAASTSWYQPAGQADDYLISPQISLQANSVLRFDAQASDANFPDGYEVLISTTTPTISALQSNPPLFSTTGENPSWTRRSVDLSAYSGNVYIAIRNNSNDNNILYIDNFLVEVAASNDDADLTNVQRVSEYSRLPQSQSVSPMVFAAIVNNAGQDTLTNVKLKYQVDNSGNIVFEDSSTVSFIAPGIDSLFVDQSTFIPTALGRYQVSYTVSHDSVDAVLTNNTMMSDSLLITDSTFARDDNRLTGVASLTAGTRGEFGNVYELNNADTLTSVAFLINNGSGQMGGRPIFYLVRSFNNGAPGPVIASSDTAGWPATAQNVFVRLNVAGGPVALPADSFFVSVVQVDSALTIGTSGGKFSVGTSLIGLSSGFVPIENTPLGARTFLIRPIFGDAGILTGLEDNGEALISDFNIYPNPSNGLVQVSMISEEANNDLQVKVLDISGKTVYEDTYVAGQIFNEQLDLSSLVGGVYFIQLNNGDVQRTEKLILK